MPLPHDVEPGSGVLLVAHPMLLDPNFKRTVILLCEHQLEEGTFGLVVNRVLPQRMNEMLVDFGAFATDLYHGGPVQTDTLHVLHRNGTLVEDGIEVVNGVHWGGDPDRIRLLVEAQQVDLDDFRFYVGYAGWGAGQLEDEIKEGAWVTAPALPAHLFDVEPDRLWRTVLRSMGGEYAILANFPEDPRMN